MKKLLLLPLLIVTCFCLAQDAKEIIGKPIKIGNLLVAQHDFNEWMKWDDAKRACAALGKGWRLPTKDEWDILIQNKHKIGCLVGLDYWSSTEVGSNNEAFGQSVAAINIKGMYEKIKFSLSVRAVRSL